MKQVERSNLIVATEIIAVCTKHNLSIDDITHKIYRNRNMKNRFRVFLCVEALLKHEVLIPQFKNGMLCFRYNDGFKENKK